MRNEYEKFSFIGILSWCWGSVVCVIPGFNGGMKPDFMLTMMFIGILLFPNVREVFLLLLLQAYSRTIFYVSWGFVPNIIDKFVTAFVFYAVVVLLETAQKIAVSAVLAGVGTIISGSVFLGSAIL